MSIFNFFKKKPEPIKEASTESRTTISIKYSYEWNDDVPQADRKIENACNDFCKRLMELNRYYTRVDIESMSERLGYSVYDQKGGAGCRHQWKSNTVVQKV